jgi:hypothetical protein
VALYAKEAPAYALSSLMWQLRVPHEQTEPRNIQLNIARLLAGEALAVRLDIAVPPKGSNRGRVCERVLLVRVASREIVSIGRAAVGVGDLCF